jgi:hypothetical protein
MKKVLNINLGGRIIEIEHSACKIYQTYIESLHYYFINEECGFEIINDIENRIAELMQGIINKHDNSLNETDMKNIIRIVGTADEFKELDTDDWDISSTSTEHYNTGNGVSTVKPFYNLIENEPSHLEGFKLCCN